MRRTRHKGGYKASSDELDLVVKMSRITKLDESWFGEIDEFRTANGEVVHEVLDNEEGRWLSFRFAVKLMDESVGVIWGYGLTDNEIKVWDSLLRKLGIISRREDAASFWNLRMACMNRASLKAAMDDISDMDRKMHRSRNLHLKVFRTKSNVYYLDLSDKGAWQRAYERYVCYRLHIPFEVIYTYDGKRYWHVVNNGEMVTMSMSTDLWELFLPPEDIVKKPAGAGSGE